MYISNHTDIQTANFPCKDYDNKMITLTLMMQLHNFILKNVWWD